MKRLSTIALMILLVGCQQGGSSNSGNGGGQKPGPWKPTAPLQWGELACQETRSCEDPVLNKSLPDLVDFFALNFANPQAKQTQDTHEMLIFRCGLKTQKKWVEFFHVQPASNEEKAIAESDFFDSTLEWESCTYADKLQEKITTYFRNTKEYKNESQ